jgi:hypothetical protein
LLRVASYTALAVAAFGLAKLLMVAVEWHAFMEATTSLLAGAAFYFGPLILLRDRTLREVYEYFRRAHPRLAR